MSNYKGKERRVSQDEMLGYIHAKVEGLDEKLSNHMDIEEGVIASIKEEVKANSESLKAIEKAIDMQANTHKYIWLTIKSFAGAIFLALTVKGGDLWHYFIGK